MFCYNVLIVYNFSSPPPPPACRKARKLGLLELAILLLVIVTVGQFIVGWSMYLERKYEMVR